MRCLMAGYPGLTLIIFRWLEIISAGNPRTDNLMIQCADISLKSGINVSPRTKQIDQQEAVFNIVGGV